MRLPLVLAALLALALVSPARAQVKKDETKKEDPKKDEVKKDDAKKEDPKKDDPKKEDPKKASPKKPAVPPPPRGTLDKSEAEKKLVRKQQLAGEIVHVEPNKAAFRLKVPYQYAELNQGELNALLEAQRALARARSAQDVVNARNDIVKHQANLYSVKTSHKEFNLDAAEKFQVRLPAPKAAFDDMGNVKRYTARELAALRGRDGKYEGDFADLTTGQVVQVSVVVPKASAAPKSKDGVPPEEPKVEASRVVVLVQPRPGR